MDQEDSLLSVEYEKRPYDANSVDTITDIIHNLKEDGEAYANTKQLYEKKEKPLKLWSLVVLIFFGVSGGPYGIEATVKYGVCRAF